MIRRTSLPARSSVLPRSTKPIRRRNAKRHDKNWLRAYHSVRRVEWVQSLPCCACGNGPSQNAHTVGGGGSRKADYDTIAPACDACHKFTHSHGWTRLELEFGFDREEAAANTQRMWLAYSTGEAA